MKRILILFAVLLLLCACALAEEGAVQMPQPAEMTPVEGFEPVALYCGPTQGFYRFAEQTIDLTDSFVCFGQDDCWVMVAQGTKDAFGPIGWIEGGLFDAQLVPELSFDEAFAAMVEEDAAVTNDPLNPEGLWDTVLPQGTPVTVLCGYGDWLYIQSDLDGVPARLFIPRTSIE